jgi:hypothetical protein
MLSAIMANMVATKNQPKSRCFNAAKAIFLPIREGFGVDVVA